MKAFDMEHPAVTPPSELAFPDGVKWAFLAMDDGVPTTTTATVSNDPRATELLDIPVLGTLGTLWSANPGFATPNGSAYATQLLSADAAIEDVFEFYGKSGIIAFSACIGFEASATMPIMWIGSGSGGTNSGILIQNTINTGIIQGLLYRASGSPNFLSTGTAAFGQRIQISGINITAPTAPVITTSAAHGLEIGDYTYISRTDTTPVIDGLYKVTAVGSTTTFTITTASISNAGTQTGDVSPESYVFMVFDGVRETIQWHFMDKRGTTVVSGSETSTTGFDFNMRGSVTPRVTILTNRFVSPIANKGLFRRFLFVNYGAQSILDVAPTLVTKIIPSLQKSALVPTRELLNG